MFLFDIRSHIKCIHLDFHQSYWLIVFVRTHYSQSQIRTIYAISYCLPGGQGCHGLAHALTLLAVGVQQLPRRQSATTAGSQTQNNHRFIITANIQFLLLLQVYASRRRPQVVVAGGHNIPESQESLFAAGGRHSCLWPKATRIYESDVPAKIGTFSHTKHTFSLFYCRIPGGGR